MNLSNTIEQAWNELSEVISQKTVCNPSVIAIKFCEAIREAVPNTKISYDNRDIPEDAYRPNLVIWEGDAQPKITFLGRLVIGPSGISQQREIERLLTAIDQMQFDVLERNNETGNYFETSMGFADGFHFGLFVVNENGETKDLYQSLINCIPIEKLERFLFAQNHESSKRTSSFHRHGAHQAPISFVIGGGRVLYVDLLVIETRLADWSLENYSKNDLPLLAKRNRLDWEHDQWFDPDEVHFILPRGFTDSKEFEKGALVSVVLYSKPISSGHSFSELMVVFYSSDIEDRSIRDCLLETSRDLEWDELAIDRKGTINKYF